MATFGTLVIDATVAAPGSDWKLQTSLNSFLNEIAINAEANPNSTDMSAAL
jgi:hypothetical protein